jgi:hypothetical protein
MEVDELDEEEEEHLVPTGLYAFPNPLFAPADDESVVKAKKILSQHKVRTSTRDRTLDEMLPSFPSRSQSGTPRTPAAGGGRDAPIEVGDAPTPMSAAKDRPIEEAACSLVSVEGLREEVTKARHHGKGVSSAACTPS